MTGRDDPPPWLMVITGICGSGKSTVGRGLAGRFPRCTLVEGDAFSRMVVSGRTEMAPEPSRDAIVQFELRLRLLASVAESYVRAGFTTIAEDNVHGPYLQWFVDLLDIRPVHVVALAPNAEICAQRDAGRNKHAYGPGRWSAAELDLAFREQTAKIGLWLDTSGQSPHETVDEIVRRIDESEVR
jgi:chloramphenicol 3-O-phosphotransferase